MARQLIKWGVRPAAVLGIGVGALVAATVAGALPLADAVSLVLQRAALVSRLGVTAAANRIAELTAQASRLQPEIPIIPGVRHLGSALSGLLAEPERILVELGIGQSLTTLAGQRPEYTAEHLLVPALTGPADRPSMLSALGRLWLAGTPVNWPAVHDGRRRARVALPTYPFERQRHVVEVLDQPDPQPAGQEPRPHSNGNAHPAHPARPARPARPFGPAGPTVNGHRQNEALPVVAQLFAEILGLPEVDPDDSFFDLGGDSLIAAQLLARTRETFCVDIGLRSLFGAPTAAEFAVLIDESTP